MTPFTAHHARALVSSTVDGLSVGLAEAALAVLRDAAWQGEQSYVPDGSPVVPPIVKVSPH